MFYPTTIDFKNKRDFRKDQNIKIVSTSIENNDLETFYKNINKKEYERTLIKLEMNKDELFKKCKEDKDFRVLLSIHISKIASRQGIKDETEQLEVCGQTAQKFDIVIKKLNSKELRPTKDGRIISESEMKSQKIPKDRCLKSFDAEIAGNMNGYITAKVSYGKGGHQDNVFDEMDHYANWWKQYRDKADDILVILIDTDLENKFNAIKQKYCNTKNIMIFNHIEFQQYLIDTYSNQ